MVILKSCWSLHHKLKASQGRDCGHIGRSNQPNGREFVGIIAHASSGSDISQVLIYLDSNSKTSSAVSPSLLLLMMVLVLVLAILHVTPGIYATWIFELGCHRGS